MTSQQEIREWLERAEGKHTHMLVVCDEFDWDDYPVFITSDEDAKEKAKEYNEKDMTRVMEVYDLSMPTQNQLEEERAFNY